MNPENIIMNNGNLDSAPGERLAGAMRSSRPAGNPDELSRLKHELLQAEVRLAKARATVVSAEIDIKVINARLKALTH
ncbi:MAG TPA: hypothetical protein VGD81_07245 [Opitutaceae bacterium]